MQCEVLNLERREKRRENIEHSTLNTQHWALQTKHWTLNMEVKSRERKSSQVNYCVAQWLLVVWGSEFVLKLKWMALRVQFGLYFVSLCVTRKKIGRESTVNEWPEIEWLKSHSLSSLLLSDAMSRASTHTLDTWVKVEQANEQRTHQWHLHSTRLMCPGFLVSTIRTGPRRTRRESTHMTLHITERGEEKRTHLSWG